MFNPGEGLVFVGLPGSGKTTMGQSFASLLNKSFIDTDQIIARRAGMSVAEYFRLHGEAAFRLVEHEVIEEACADSGAVIATGGGALNDPLNRWRLWLHGRVVRLEAPEEILLARLAADSVIRPLLQTADPLARLRELAAEREPFYRAADVTVAADMSVPQLIEQILTSLAQPLLSGRRLFDALEPRHHPIGPPSARIVYGHDLQALVSSALSEIGGVPSLVYDRNIGQSNFVPNDARQLALTGGESIKTMQSLEDILAWLSDNAAERRDPVVSIGGGTIGDLVGMAAALYSRGVPYMALPTTWLAQLDAALGGKAAVDLNQAKNKVGAFWPAWAVFNDMAFLRRLPMSHRRDGMAEALKAGLIGDPDLWQLIGERGVAALKQDEMARYAITELAARVKLNIVRRDPFDEGERQQLNLGHTVAHGLEAVSNYQLSHGNAVALGLRAAAELARRRGGDTDLGESLDEQLRTLGFQLHYSFDAGAVREAIGTDKKRKSGLQHWLLPMTIGKVVEVNDITDDELAAALAVITKA